jgi:hypothetical protein
MADTQSVDPLGRSYDPVASGDIREVVPGQYAVGVNKEARFYGWLLYKHPDGQWVSLRKLSVGEFSLLSESYKFGAQHG